MSQKSTKTIIWQQIGAGIIACSAQYLIDKTLKHYKNKKQQEMYLQKYPNLFQILQKLLNDYKKIWQEIPIIGEQILIEQNTKTEMILTFTAVYKTFLNINKITSIQFQNLLKTEFKSKKLNYVIEGIIEFQQNVKNQKKYFDLYIKNEVKSHHYNELVSNQIDFEGFGKNLGLSEEILVKFPSQRILYVVETIYRELSKTMIQQYTKAKLQYPKDRTFIQKDQFYKLLIEDSKIATFKDLILNELELGISNEEYQKLLRKYSQQNYEFQKSLSQLEQNFRKVIEYISFMSFKCRVCQQNLKAKFNQLQQDKKCLSCNIDLGEDLRYHCSEHPEEEVCIHCFNHGDIEEYKIIQQSLSYEDVLNKFFQSTEKYMEVYSPYIAQKQKQQLNQNQNQKSDKDVGKKDSDDFEIIEK